ncbi:MAG: Flp pilus assembly complex ATPase component TadA [Synergistaceae bacterium]|nr:Flp pilus assembly complex ATPase component TadA [Synergistaceae bacterium]
MELSRKQPKLGDILVQAGVISEQQLMDTLQKQKRTGKRLGEILISEGIMTEIRLAEALSTQLKMPMFTLTRYRPMPEAIKAVPRHVSERLQLIPLAIAEGDSLLIAMVNPLDLLAQDEVRMLTGKELKVGITTASEIKTNLDRLYNLHGTLEEAIIEVYKDGKMPTEEAASEAGADDAPVIQLVSNILEQAVREGASDIHVEPYEKEARVRYRVDGALYMPFDYPVALHPAVSARVKIMAGMDIAERRKPQDGRILMKVAGRRIDMRVSSLPTMVGEKMVLRILDQDSSAVGLDRLGLEQDDMEKIEVFCTTPWGIMLVTGPTGSGKSTTLYSILQKINHPDVNIITVEDPVEFTVAGINQVHVNEKAGLTFESALRSILRQDPDKVMVGEIRDQKTAQIAIRAALTGHFVLSTLHTNDAPSAATRMVDMGVPPFLVSASLSGVVAQRLVRRLCPFCKEEYEMPPKMCEALEVPDGTHAWKPIGCNNCRAGYKGRKGIYEIMLVDDDLRKMILEGASNIVLRSAAINKGMKTLRKSGLNNAIAGFTSIEEVFATSL